MGENTDFLRNEFWILSWNASVQRAVRYRKECTGRERREFRRFIIDHCERSILPVYRLPVSEGEHIDNIVALRDVAQGYAMPRLLEKPYNVGVSQKLLNLQLKYLWCLELIPMPPHCPVDRIVLGHTSLKNRMNWTEISDVAEYQRAIDAIREVAGNRPIACWELEIYDRTTR